MRRSDVRSSRKSTQKRVKGEGKLASLGYYATRYIFEKYAIALPSKLEFHGVCGKVLEAGDKEILPLQHPAALLYNSSIKGDMVQDYSKMRIVFTNHMEESD